ncbi:MAG TPA: hypothetical protein VN636_19530 [Acidimicrobiia bacterium]|nr:hypothetical protein [Acidimicrobiia bacterium]
MEPGGISVTRTLPIDGALLADVLLRLRRDTGASALRWTLGDRGAAEVDVNFTTAGSSWITAARVWDASGLAVASVGLRVMATGADTVSLTLQPTSALTPRWLDQLPVLLDLAQAVIDEVAEELLWHATRAGVATSG